MIPDNELREGNYVTYKGAMCRYAVSMPPASVSAIQITVGRVRKLGFVEENGYFVHKSESFKLIVLHYKNGIWIATMGYEWKREIRYIHQLQNIFWGLTGFGLWSVRRIN